MQRPILPSGCHRICSRLKKKRTEKVPISLPRVQIAEYENHYQDKPKWDIYDKLSHDRRAGNDYEGFFRELCDRYQMDFTPFYEHWGMSVSGSEREYASRYPLLDKQIWKINPLSDDPFEDVGQYETSSFRYRVNRSAWKVAAWDSEGRETRTRSINLSLIGRLRTIFWMAIPILTGVLTFLPITEGIRILRANFHIMWSSTWERSRR